ncbi:MAG: sodium:proton antiporter [Gammaproteobacteria bacterium]|nr:sodium:proton antiporter [Gammaproteobacteria bacterium]
MTLFQIIALVLSLTAVFSYINYRFIKLPITIGVMLLSLVFSLILILLSNFGVNLHEKAETILSQIDFNQTLMHGMLSFLLFAGALHVNINDLRKQKWVIGTLATIGVITSTFLTGTAAYYILNFLGIEISYIYALIFGALISPTDPIAVLGILKLVGAPKTLETKITGESLFNDGVGVVVFIVLVGIATSGADISAASVVGLFATEALGGLFFGFGLGFIGYWMLKTIDNYQVEVLITLGLVTGGYALAGALHLSAPIAIVVAGLMIGNHGRLFAMSDQTRKRLDNFWELVDEILNAVLFLLIGLEVIILTFTGQYLLAGVIMIFVVLLSRLISIGMPIQILKQFRDFTPYVVTIMTWGGLRGGISVALALSLPAVPAREPILVITYCIVVFSILVQGLTVKKVLKLADRGDK